MRHTAYQLTQGEYSDQQWFDVFEDKDEALAAAAAFNKAKPTPAMQREIDDLSYGPIMVDGAMVDTVEELPDSFWLPAHEDDRAAVYVEERHYYPRSAWHAEKAGSQ